MDTAVGLEVLARHQHGVAGVWQALAAGASRAQVDRLVAAGRFERGSRGLIVLPGTEATFSHRVMAAVVQSRTGAAGFRAAAQLLEIIRLPMPPVELLVPRGSERRVPGARIVRTSHLDAADLTEVNCIPTTTIARTLVDLGSVWGDRSVERAFEAAARMARVDERHVLAVADRLGTGYPGVSVIRRVLGWVPAGEEPTGSELEARFLQLLRTAGLPLPTRQHHMRRSDGRSAYIDTAYTRWRILIEIEGAAPHDTAAGRRSDRERFNALPVGVDRFLRFDREMIERRPDYVVREVYRALLAAGAFEP